MAVSSSIDFAMTGQEIVVRARRLLGVHADEEPLQAHELVAGIQALNMMLKAWQADGVKYWTMTEGELALVQSQVSYSFASGGDFTTVPLDIMQMRITRSGTDLEMTELSREDYYNLPLKTNEGYPTQWFYDRQRESGTLYVWPSPDASAGTLKFSYRRTIMDVDAGANNVDLPQEWYEALTTNLAKRLIPDYGKSGTPIAQEVRMDAALAYDIVKGFDTAEGEGSISITPDWN